MNAYISQVIHAFNGWDGIKHSIKMYETSNRLIQAYVFEDEDNRLNPSTIKQLYQYNRMEYLAMLAQGYAFTYQGIEYNLTLKSGYLFLAYTNPKTNAKNRNGAFTLTETGIRGYGRKEDALKDVIDVANGLMAVIG